MKRLKPMMCFWKKDVFTVSIYWLCYSLGRCQLLDHLNTVDMHSSRDCKRDTGPEPVSEIDVDSCYNQGSTGILYMLIAELVFKCIYCICPNSSQLLVTLLVPCHTLTLSSPAVYTVYWLISTHSLPHCLLCLAFQPFLLIASGLDSCPSAWPLLGYVCLLWSARLLLTESKHELLPILPVFWVMHLASDLFLHWAITASLHVARLKSYD